MSEPHHYGGQAVIEGVMMRGRQAMAVAVRHPTGAVVIHSEPLKGRVYRSRWAKRPFIRGAVLLWDTLALGMRALMYSANVALEDEAPGARAKENETAARAKENETAAPGRGDAAGAVAGPIASPSAAERSAAAAQEAFGGGLMWGTMVVALLFGIGIFFVSPLLLTRLIDPVLPSAAASVLVEGFIRIALFFGYVWAIGRLPDVRRVFAYHGAEHKAINAYEAGELLRADRVGRYSVAHPRCGTSFLLLVVVLSIFVFGLLGRPSLAARIASRIVLVPVVASLAYELIRFSARRYANRVVRFLLAPGMALQALTTREPDASQVEVAIAALKRVLDLDGAGDALAAATQGAAPDTVPTGTAASPIT